MRAGMTSSIAHSEWPTVVISAPHCGQTRSSRRHALNDLHAREMRRQRAAPVDDVPLRAGFVRLGFRLGGRAASRQPRERQHELALEALERLGARALATQMRELLDQLGVDVAHPRDERQDRRDELDEAQRLDHPLQPRAHRLESGAYGEVIGGSFFTRAWTNLAQHLDSRDAYDFRWCSARLPSRTPSRAREVDSLDDQASSAASIALTASTPSPEKHGESARSRRL